MRNPVSEMFGKIRKYLLRGLLLPVALLVLLPTALYVPAVQRWACTRAEEYLSRTLGMELSVERIRLAFPLHLTVDRAVLRDGGDTLLRCGRLDVAIAPLPLLRGELAVRRLELSDLGGRYTDSLAGMDARVEVGNLALRIARINLRKHTLSLFRADLARADVALDLGTSAESAPKADTAAAPWRISIGRFTVSNTAFRMRTASGGMELETTLADGTVDGCEVDLAASQVAVSRLALDRGAYTCRLAAGPAEDAEPAAAVAESASPAVPWQVRVERITLRDNRMAYGTLGHRPAAGFDPEALELTGVNLEVDSLWNRGSDIALRLAGLSFAERSGLAVSDAAGRFSMDSTGISLSGFRVATPRSQIAAEAHAGAGIAALDPLTPLSADVRMTLAAADLTPWVVFPGTLQNRLLSGQFSVAGTLGNIPEAALCLSIPDMLIINISGTAKNLPDPKRAVASARFSGDLRNLDPLRALLPDTALRRRIALPREMTLCGTATADCGRVAADLLLSVAGGRLSAAAGFDPASEAYRAELRCDSFPLGRFLPGDSLGYVDLALEAEGTGLDPLSERARAAVRAQIDRMEFRGYDFGGPELKASLSEGRLSGTVADRNEALQLALALSGTLSEESQEVRLQGSVAGFDLQRMGLVAEPIGGSFLLDLRAAATVAGSREARLELDSLTIRNGYRTDRIRPTSLTFGTDSVSVRVGAASGDLSFSFASFVPLDSLAARITRSAGRLDAQLHEGAFDMTALQEVLPPFTLRVDAGRNNILNNFLKTKQLAFKALHAAGDGGPETPAALHLQVEGLTTPGFVLDSVALGVRQQGRELEYGLHIANGPGHLDHLAQAALYGRIGQHAGTVRLLQRNRTGQTGFRFGWDLVWNDSLFRARMNPLDPVFGAETWSVNAGNYVEYDFDRRLSADLDLHCGSRRFAIRSLPAGDTGIGGVQIDVGGVDIGAALGLLPSAPPVGGTFGADLFVGLSSDSLAVRGDLSLDSLAYRKQPFGDVALGVRYGQGRDHRADARLTLDGQEVLAAHGDYRAGREEPLDVLLTVPGLPLQRLDPFLPAELLRLSGDLWARVHVGGDTGRPEIDGDLCFAATTVRVPMIGSTFRLAQDTIRLRNGLLRFDGYDLYAPNGAPMTIRGSVDLLAAGGATADLGLRASDFRFVDVARKARTAVYGVASLNADLTARGPLDALAVRGRVALLNGTEVGYVMQDAPMEVENRPQQIVRFVSFSELDEEPLLEAPAKTARLGGMDVQLGIDIGNDVRAGVDLSADGSNRIDLEGGGSLTFTMNPLGDMNLSGKYVLSGGAVRYNPPVISPKNFRILPDGYVEWVGDVADPSFNITAVERVRASVSTDGEQSRSVNFDISIRISNTLNDLSVTFDLAAPDDLSMQNALRSLTPEQRAMQAMNLLIYNTYNGPGTTAKVQAGNPLNAFIQKELNQWAQNSLKGVDLSFGIDSYDADDPGGQHTDYSYRLSKNLFSNRVRAVIGGKFSTDSDPSENLRENLIDDLSLEYLLTKSGNMYIRIFRHTDYEILEGEITQTGVGFVIRKRMSRLGDLFRSGRLKTKKNETHDESDGEHTQQ